MRLSELTEQQDAALEESGEDDPEVIFSFPTDDGRAYSHEAEVHVIEGKIFITVYSN